MAFSDMLFSTTHSVEELVDIKQQKKVDKVLLKVIRTIRSKGNLDGWVKPEANLKTDLKLSDRVIASIKKSLSEYYNVDLTKNNSLNSAKAITAYIKVNRSNVTDSIYLINVDETETDANDEVQMDSEMVDPNIDRPAEDAPVQIEPRDPAMPASPEPHQVVPTMQEPTDELQPDSATVEESDAGETTPDEETAQGGTVEVSTEGIDNPKLKGKFVWTYYTRAKEGIKEKMITIGATPNGRYACKVFPTKEQLIAYLSKGENTPHSAPYALGIPFNYIKKFLTKQDGAMVISEQVKVPVAICMIDKIPTEKIVHKSASKENFGFSVEGLSYRPTKVESWADVMNRL